MGEGTDERGSPSAREYGVNWGAVFGAAAIIPLLNASIRLAVPTGLAAVGESLCQRAGVLNLSLEGMMLSGAYAAFLAPTTAASPGWASRPGSGAGCSSAC